MDNKVERKVVASIIDRYETAHGPLKVLDSSYTPYVLKFPKNRFDNGSIIKEFICHFLLKSWMIPTTEIASLSVSSELLESCSFLTNREKELIENYDCFGSKLLINAVDLMHFITADNTVAQRKIMNPSDIIKIALFDIWVENEDRKPSNNNLLLNTSGDLFEIIPIDHAYTFSSLNFEELKHRSVNFSFNDSILHSPLATSIVKKTKLDAEFFNKYENMFYICIENAESFFSKNIDILSDNLAFTDEDKTFLSSFLFNKRRNRLVWEEFIYIINTITQ